MTKFDVLAGAKGKPVPFEHDGFTCLLRPMNVSERRDLFEYLTAHGEEPGSGFELQSRLVMVAVCDENGVKLIERADLEAFGVPVLEAIAKEVARRNGMDGKAAGEPGKSDAPTTKS